MVAFERGVGFYRVEIDRLQIRASPIIIMMILDYDLFSLLRLLLWFDSDSPRVAFALARCCHFSLRDDEMTY